MGRSHSIVDHASLRNPIRRVDPGNGPGPLMNEVVADGTNPIVEIYMPVKVMEDEEAGKKEPGRPEWVGNPGIQVIIGLGRRVISDYRRALAIIVIVYDLGVRTRGEITSLGNHHF